MLDGVGKAVSSLFEALSNAFFALVKFRTWLCSLICVSVPSSKRVPRRSARRKR